MVNKPTKRYAGKTVQALLGRVVAFAEAPSVTMVDAQTRRLLGDLLTVGQFYVDSETRQEIIGPTEPRTRRKGKIAPWSASDVARYQGELRAFFRDLTYDHELEGMNIPSLLIERVTIRSLRLRRLVAHLGGDAESVLRLKTVILLQMAGTERLRQCECGRVYVKTGRREYCSGRCQKRVYMREYRGKPTRTNRRPR